MVYILKKGAKKKEMDTLEKKIGTPNGVDTKKFCGVLKLKKNALTLQKQWRNEWK